MTKSRIVVCLVLLALSAPLRAQYPGSKPVPEPMKTGFDDIDVDQCRSWLEVIASDDFAGRKTGSEGHRKAAAFVAERFKEFGLKPVGDQGGYFQTVPLFRLRPGGAGPRVEAGGLLLEGEGVSQRLTAGEVEAEAIVIAAGDKAKLDDPELLRGKVLLLNAHRDLLKSPARRQIVAARPAALILAEKSVSPLSGVTPGRLAQIWEAKTPTVVLSEEAYGQLLAALKVKASFGGKAPRSGLQLARGKGMVAVRATAEEERIEAPNVVGVLEGSDPKLRDEYVICGSHLDHIGVTRDGAICNGADDDGSGSTSLLAVARAFSRNPERPKRSLLFIAVCGEEDGLLGSEYYVENPIVPIADTICELQMDMVGRNEESEREKAQDNLRTTHLVGTRKLSRDLHDLIQEVNRYVRFEFEYDEEGVWNRSDHYNFAAKGIPIAFVFSGFHKDYHKPTDTVDKINFEKLANTARLIYLTAFHAADRAKRIVVDQKEIE
ncbi:MAG: M28 family peptidase [Planctomycetes bacterium]|nr:M28 family peptidase [Planctomycetota bacterium]